MSCVAWSSLPSLFAPFRPMPRALSRLAFDCCLENALLGGAQVGHRILVINGHQPNLPIRKKIVVNQAESAALSFASPCIRPPELSEAAGARDHVARFRIAAQMLLKLAIFVVRQEVRADLRQYRRLNELHYSLIPKFPLLIQAPSPVLH